MSADEHGLTVDLDAAMDSSSDSDAGVPAGRELLAFATALNQRSANLPEVRRNLEESLGSEALVEACATVAIFNGLVRVADGTGIQLDPSLISATTDSRADLGIDSFAGAANSEGATTTPRHGGEGIASLFA